MAACIISPYLFSMSLLALGGSTLAPDFFTLTLIYPIYTYLPFELYGPYRTLTSFPHRGHPNPNIHCRILIITLK